MAEEGEYAYLATLEAFRMAGIDLEYLEKNETGIFYGNDSSAKAVIESNHIMEEKKDIGESIILKWILG